MRSSFAATIIAIAITSAAAQAADAARDRQAELRDVIDGRVRGAANSCILLRDIRSTRIIKDTAIVFETFGSSIYDNQPRRSARGLRESDAIVSRTPSGRLCEIDAVDLIDRPSQTPTGFVFLGEFVRYDRPKG